ncbi:hypothetical protein Q3O60_13685 [Alkalimonas collagenimarina]|uniref:Transmembrane protein n=1 Tax=Alkalimonas collagenimarina TaxID=400390 RepID=A0ABT9H1S5_9GAMM|nr:hypothetical protein [Alkalimonas collagenimarina]MDP4537238.1 hypothetical protein [Alkalimonas collagenimarina]
MLSFYHRLARILAPAFWWLLAAAILFGMLFIWLLLTSEQSHQASVLFWLLLMLAMLGLLLVIKWFATPAPELNETKGFFLRCKVRLVRLGYLLLALITSFIMLAIAVLGARIGFGGLMRWLLGA